MHVLTAVFAIVVGAVGLGVGYFTVEPAIARYTKGGRRRHWIVASLTGVLFAALGLRFGPVAALPAYLYLAAVSVILGTIDVAVQRLPDPFTLRSCHVALVLLPGGFLIAGGGDDPLPSIIWAVVGSLAMWLLYFLQFILAPVNAIGFGDVKLALLLGMYLGWLGGDPWLHGVLGGFFAGGLFSLGAMITGKKGRKSFIPFGPFMLLGAFLSILYHAGTP